MPKVFRIAHIIGNESLFESTHASTAEHCANLARDLSRIVGSPLEPYREESAFIMQPIVKLIDCYQHDRSGLVLVVRFGRGRNPYSVRQPGRTLNGINIVLPDCA
jgi:hypothetical protein